MNNSIKRLQTPLQDLYLRRLSSSFSRPKANPSNPISGGIAPNTMRGNPAFAREVLNRAQIALLEFSYRSDAGTRKGDISLLNPIAGAGVSGANLVVTYDGSNTTTFSAGETDQVTWTGDGNYELVVNSGVGDVVGKRRVTWPEPLPHSGFSIAGAAG